MTDLVAELPSPETGDVADVAELADTVFDLVQAVQRARARWLAAAEHSVERTGLVILRTVRSGGPMRASDIADSLQFDPSTVSRRVAALVRDGLLERRADPEDGRASLLAPTPKADAVLADQRRVRADHFAAMLSGWERDEVVQLTGLMRRFTAAYDDVTTRHATTTAEDDTH
ncbi:DNA-binding transcriptional regulator, MarR family [Jatrophihabitans endophyticus]|uniref:DNA-binding transcriptional regulator, MarR family n=1 Tax=Jatrophihabitans endophyticus TaxID=1206085 RepID=A0A1M5HFR3_9ACTN|nr:MarR family transcriptional regulator [Jatrophihabitans endophyticus]SHG14773.1 DNA-binding transcriptional regulator, MarR family [Jatrophihabitans endophyticus]